MTAEAVTPWRTVAATGHRPQHMTPERRCGFHNTLGQPDEPATASFTHATKGVRGHIEYGSATKEGQA